MALPPLLYVIAGFRHTTGLQPWAVLDSVSDYYYTGAVAAFVGVLFALAVFFFTYRGYDNADLRRDRVAAFIAGAAALLVAFCPKRPPLESLRPSWWTPRIGTVHYVAAVVLFGSFLFFALVLFRKHKGSPGERLPWCKRVRNAIQIGCSVGMVVCLVWAGIALHHGAAIVLPEALAVELFAVTWLVKGRVDQTAIATARRTLHYGRHPGRLLARVRSAVRRQRGSAR
jgi:hypothetical protein